MNHGLGVNHVVEAFGDRHGHEQLNDDLKVAAMMNARTRGGFGRRVAMGLRSGLAAIGAKLSGGPETFEESVARLASVSPHLLDDVGLQAEGKVAPVEEVHAGRGLVRTRLVEDRADAATPGVIVAPVKTEMGPQRDTTMGNPVPAE